MQLECKQTLQNSLSSAGRVSCQQPGCGRAGRLAGLSHQAMRGPSKRCPARALRSLLLCKHPAPQERGLADHVHRSCNKDVIDSFRHSSVAHTTSPGALASDPCCTKHPMKANSSKAHWRTLQARTLPPEQRTMAPETMEKLNMTAVTLWSSSHPTAGRLAAGLWSQNKRKSSTRLL